MAKYSPRKPKLSLVPKAPGTDALQGQVRGFCTTPLAKKALLEHGLLAKAIYLDGAGAESMATCLRSYRGRPGWLILAQDLTAFGKRKRDVADRADALEKVGIRLLDITHPNDQTYAAMVHRANGVISGNRYSKNRKMARKQGRIGGTRNGEEAERKRNDLAPAWLIDRIVDCTDIPWDLKAELFAPYISKATLRRHYGVKAALRRA